MSLFHGQRIPSSVSEPIPSTSIIDAFVNVHDADINSELDELDREEFYRLKKVRFSAR